MKLPRWDAENRPQPRSANLPANLPASGDRVKLVPSADNNELCYLMCDRKMDPVEIQKCYDICNSR